MVETRCIQRPPEPRKDVNKHLWLFRLADGEYQNVPRQKLRRIPNTEKRPLNSFFFRLRRIAKGAFEKKNAYVRRFRRKVLQKQKIESGEECWAPKVACCTVAPKGYFDLNVAPAQQRNSYLMLWYRYILHESQIYLLCRCPALYVQVAKCKLLIMVAGTTCYYSLHTRYHSLFPSSGRPCVGSAFRYYRYLYTRYSIYSVCFRCESMVYNSCSSILSLSANLSKVLISHVGYVHCLWPLICVLTWPWSNCP